MALSKEEKAYRKEQRRLIKWEETHKYIDGVDHKICGHCAKWFPANEEYFYKKKINQTDGLDTYCKACIVLKAKNSNFDYESMKKKSREWKMKKENRERVNRHHKKYKEAGKETEWRRNNKDKVKEYIQKRTSHKKHEISKREWEYCKEYFDYSCAYCGIHEDEAKIKYNNYLHKEHVNHDGSNRLDNCVPSCKSCNGSKNVYSLGEWYNKENHRFNRRRLNKIKKWLNGDYEYYIEPKKLYSDLKIK